MVVMVTVVVRSNKSFAQIQPQIRVNSDLLAGLVAVAVNDDKAFLFNSEEDVGFLGNCQRVCVRLDRCQQAQKE